MANTTPAPAANPSTAVIIASHLVPSYDVPFAFKAWRYQRIHPKGETPCDHLQSPQKLPDLAHPDEAMYRWPPQIIAREKGGSNNNHVQWIKSAKLVALNGPDEIAFAHGVLIRDSGEHSKEGDKVWLMSEDPLQGEGGKIVHVVNLDQLIDTTVSIKDVKWRPDKRWIHDRGLFLTLAGPLWPGALGVLGQSPYRMVVQFRPVPQQTQNRQPGTEVVDDNKYLMIRRLHIDDECEWVTAENLNDLPEEEPRRGVVTKMFGWFRRSSTSGDSSSARRNSRPHLL